MEGLRRVYRHRYQVYAHVEGYIRPRRRSRGCAQSRILREWIDVENSLRERVSRAGAFIRASGSRRASEKLELATAKVFFFSFLNKKLRGIVSQWSDRNVITLFLIYFGAVDAEWRVKNVRSIVDGADEAQIVSIDWYPSFHTSNMCQSVLRIPRRLPSRDYRFFF